MLMGCLSGWSVWRGQHFDPPQLRDISSTQSARILRGYDGGKLHENFLPMDLMLVERWADEVS
jgi:hypothetical protein